MNPKESRDRLFKGQSPVVRLIIPNDMRWLYGAHKMSGGKKEQDEFAEWYASNASQYDEVFIVDDRSNAYREGWGAVGAIYCRYDGWRLEPEADWFPWATKTNVLRSCVSFLLYCRHSKDVGTVYVHSPDVHKEFFTKIKKYVSLYPVKSIPGGLPSGKDNLFYLRGKKKYATVRQHNNNH